MIIKFLACVAGVWRGGKRKNERVKREKISYLLRLPRSFWISPFSTACHAGYKIFERGEQLAKTSRIAKSHTKKGIKTCKTSQEEKSTLNKPEAWSWNKPVHHQESCPHPLPHHPKLRASPSGPFQLRPDLSLPFLWVAPFQRKTSRHRGGGTLS